MVIEDTRTLLLPDRRGNNRMDSLRNILADPRIALLFFVPGVNETLRVNGRASIVIEPSMLERFTFEGKAPRSVLRITVETVYFQCCRALVRSRLWDPAPCARERGASALSDLAAALRAHQVVRTAHAGVALPVPTTMVPERLTHSGGTS
ncbi:pyridoxamine 5'-phosphate oxidase family protein [Archangium violaceum]|uniref:pyridoxamine 5'-phosphate oxidase family protein n=1 Tax=Archangium violaceum TaxID=83451 RepID=UPI002B2FBBD2|nr:pyridoxamine 5'-phosphate oxidase family protein [Archangium gephyra]